jgi:hypothetical protein
MKRLVLASLIGMALALSACRSKSQLAGLAADTDNAYLANGNCARRTAQRRAATLVVSKSSGQAFISTQPWPGWRSGCQCGYRQEFTAWIRKPTRELAAPLVADNHCRPPLVVEDTIMATNNGSRTRPS